MDKMEKRYARLAQNMSIDGTRVISERVEWKTFAKAQKWDGALPQNIYAGAPVPFLNLSK